MTSKLYSLLVEYNIAVFYFVLVFVNIKITHISGRDEKEFHFQNFNN